MDGGSDEAVTKLGECVVERDSGAVTVGLSVLPREFVIVGARAGWSGSRSVGVAKVCRGNVERALEGGQKAMEVGGVHRRKVAHGGGGARYGGSSRGSAGGDNVKQSMVGEGGVLKSGLPASQFVGGHGGPVEASSLRPRSSGDAHRREASGAVGGNPSVKAKGEILLSGGSRITSVEVQVPNEEISRFAGEVARDRCKHLVPIIRGKINGGDSESFVRWDVAKGGCDGASISNGGVAK